MTTRRRWAAVPLILVLSAWMAGCSATGSSSSPAPAAATTVTATAPTTTTTSAASDGGIPEYKPSTVTSSQDVLGVSKTVLTTPDSVEKVAAFYAEELPAGGWQVEKTTKSGATVEYKGIEGTAAIEIEISPAGTGASITVKVVP
jgi:hypothetical protein